MEQGPDRSNQTAVVHVRLTWPMVDAIDKMAKVGGQHRSAAVRELLTLALVGRGLWPPKVQR